MHQQQILLGKVFPSRILQLIPGSWHSLDGTALNLCENLTPTTPPATQGPCPHPHRPHEATQQLLLPDTVHAKHSPYVFP